MRQIAKVILLFGMVGFVGPVFGGTDAVLWHKYELPFKSDRSYENQFYNVSDFFVTFTSQTGRIRKVDGFWDGDRSWKVRFQPDETGEWTWVSNCSDEKNSGLHGKSGQFVCVKGEEDLELYQRGAIQHQPGSYHLSFADGTPFFWMACTAWNGAMKSTEADWDHYLEHRRDHNYNVIQFVTTQWRGGGGNREGEVAFEGAGRIEVNPEFFQKMDERVDRINEMGLVAAPVLLWALPSVTGRDLSPGYYLPVDEATHLAKYIVARYQGNHVVWFLGGDGRFFDHFESRWKAIGNNVFGDIDHAPATLHPHGQSFIGDLYAGESWFNIMGYQSSHSYRQATVDFINRKDIAHSWDKLRPMPYINLEPIYENIHDHQTPENVRNAIWWSLFATPVAGISYGANGIWSWIENDGGQILNHRAAPHTVSWKNSLKLPVSKEMKHLVEFWNQFDWWEFYPQPDLLLHQPGEEQYDAFVGVLSNQDQSLILAYVPKEGVISLRATPGRSYDAKWFNPMENKYTSADLQYSKGSFAVTQEGNTGRVLVMRDIESR